MEDTRLKNLPEDYKDEILKAVKILKENGAKEVYIFGSLANGNYNENSDIDIAVSGISAENFYKVAGIVMFSLETNVDIIDLDDKEDRFVNQILKSGGMLKVG